MPRKKTEIRLKPTEQVKDKKKTVGFGAGTSSTYVPIGGKSFYDLRTLVLGTVWVEACIDTIVDEVVKYPLFVDFETIREATKNELAMQSFLDEPSDTEPLFLIRKKYLKDMLRWGNGAAVVTKKSGKPYMLNTVPGYTLRVTDDEPPKYKFAKINGGSVSTDEFKQNDSGEDIVLTVDELMHFQINAESDSTLAPSPLDKIYDDLTIDKDLQKKLVQHLKKGFFKPCFLSFIKGSSVNKAELEEFVEFTNGLIGEGMKILGVNKEVSFSEMPYWSADEILAMAKWVGLKIATAYKVPPFMVNLVSDVGSLNAREQKARFLENVVTPILEYEAYMYTMVIARKGFKEINTKITSGILGTKLNWNRARIANLLKTPNQEVFTTDEIRKLFFNLPPKEKDNSSGGVDTEE